MNVLYIGFDVEGVGGIATYSRHQIQALKDLGHHLFVLSLDKQSETTRVAGVVADRHLPFLDKFQATRAVLRSLIAARGSFELVILNHVFLAGFGLAAKFLMRAPYVVNIYNIDVLARLSPPREFAFRRANLAIADCKYTLQRLPEFHRRLPPTGLLYDPVDTSFFRQIERGVARREIARRFGLTDLDGRFIAMTVASLLLPPNKGHRQTIDALAQLHDPRMLYIVVGDGPDRAAIESYALERGVAGQVRLLGFVDQPTLPHLYNAADVVVLVSRGAAGLGEAVPLGLIEASACGVPFICGNQDGSLEAIGADAPNGIAIDPDRPELLAAELTRLVENPGLARSMGANGKRMVDDVFRYERFTERLGQLLWRHLGVASDHAPHDIPLPLPAAGRHS